MSGEHSTSRRGFVYFIQVEGGGPIKIGFTASRNGTRLADIQSYCPYELTLRRFWEATVVHGRTLEYELHKRFVRHKMRGEWFRPGRALLTFIDDPDCLLRFEKRIALTSAGKRLPKPEKTTIDRERETRLRHIEAVRMFYGGDLAARTVANFYGVSRMTLYRWCGLVRTYRDPEAVAVVALIPPNVGIQHEATADGS